MWKKYASLFMSCFMLIVSLCSCGSEQQTNEPDDYDLWGKWEVYDARDDRGYTLNVSISYIMQDLTPPDIKDFYENGAGDGYLPPSEYTAAGATIYRYYLDKKDVFDENKIGSTSNYSMVYPVSQTSLEFLEQNPPYDDWLRQIYELSNVSALGELEEQFLQLVQLNGFSTENTSLYLYGYPTIDRLIAVCEDGQILIDFNFPFTEGKNEAQHCIIYRKAEL